MYEASIQKEEKTIINTVFLYSMVYVYFGVLMILLLLNYSFILVIYIYLEIN